MAKTMSPEAASADAEKRQIQDEKKRLKKEQREQKKEAKKRAAEIAKREEELDDGGANPFITFGATVLIIVLWLAVICIIVKLDIGGFGSSVLTPLLKDVPVVNRILPGNVVTETDKPENYGGYSSLEEAVAYIRQLELELERAQNEIQVKNSDIELLIAENDRLEEFEKAQVEFQRIVNNFYEEVVNHEKSPGIEEYQKWYETMNPSTAEYLYKQVLTQSQASTKIQEYARAYASDAMKPKQAAAIFEEMTDDLELVAKILNAMSVEDRGEIMGVMDSEVAAKLTKIMDPDS